MASWDWWKDKVLGGVVGGILVAIIFSVAGFFRGAYEESDLRFVAREMVNRGELSEILIERLQKKHGEALIELTAQITDHREHISNVTGLRITNEEFVVPSSLLIGDSNKQYVRIKPKGITMHFVRSGDDNKPQLELTNHPDGRRAEIVLRGKDKSDTVIDRTWTPSAPPNNENVSYFSHLKAISGVRN